MRKVICIDAKVRIGDVELKEGATYSVVSDNGCGQGCCYGLQEVFGFYNKDRFIPLDSGLDETILVTEEF